jgi:RNA polymerase sigma-70 factor, ECF subfamily
MAVDSLSINIPNTDHLLLRQVATGDQAAFGVLYDEYSTSVYNYLLRLVRERPIAEDLLQEVFLALWQGAKNFQERAKVKTWLLRIAHHQAVSWLRRNRLVSVYEELETTEDFQIEEQMVEAWEADQARRALDQLSPKHRAVIELAFVHNLAYADIAMVLDCPIGTIKSRMSYALQHLAVLMAHLNTDRS